MQLQVFVALSLESINVKTTGYGGKMNLEPNQTCIKFQKCYGSYQLVTKSVSYQLCYNRSESTRHATVAY